jgi:ADP-ribosyl-[dinitrogen reductase] hydrolase
MGSSTLKAMRDLSSGVHGALAGSCGEYSAANGVAMRIAPLAFLWDPSNPSKRALIGDVCRITHHNDEAYGGALAVVLAIRSVLADTWSQQRSFLPRIAGKLLRCSESTLRPFVLGKSLADGIEICYTC